jgi:hypothetical protein
MSIFRAAPFRRLALLAALALGSFGGIGGIARAETPLANPTVVELFTSQGCSSCPPADANLGRISDRADVLALSFGVTYWDDLGWADTFAKQEFTTRQRDYAAAFNNRSVYTPQMVVNGTGELVGHDLDELEDEIDKLAGPAATRISLGADGVTLAPGEIAGTADVAGSADVWLVRYEPGPIEIPVARGENGGRTLAITHAVRELTHLGFWDGKAVSFTLPAGDAALKRAILVQAANSGPILAAATD